MATGTDSVLWKKREILLRRTENSSPLRRADRFLRRSNRVRCAGFDLRKNNICSGPCNNIDFSPAGVIIAAKDRIPLAFQINAGKLFAQFSSCHSAPPYSKKTDGNSDQRSQVPMPKQELRWIPNLLTEEYFSESSCDESEKGRIRAAAPHAAQCRSPCAAQIRIADKAHPSAACNGHG